MIKLQDEKGVFILEEEDSEYIVIQSLFAGLRKADKPRLREVWKGKVFNWRDPEEAKLLGRVRTKTFKEACDFVCHGMYGYKEGSFKLYETKEEAEKYRS